MGTPGDHRRQMAVVGPIYSRTGMGNVGMGTKVKWLEGKQELETKWSWLRKSIDKTPIKDFNTNSKQT